MRAWPASATPYTVSKQCSAAPASSRTPGYCRNEILPSAASATPAGWATERKNSSAAYTGNPRSTCVLSGCGNSRGTGMQCGPLAGLSVRRTPAVSYRPSRTFSNRFHVCPLRLVIVTSFRSTG